MVGQSGTVSSCCYETAGLAGGGEREKHRDNGGERYNTSSLHLNFYNIFLLACSMHY